MTLAADLRRAYHLADVGPEHLLRRAADELERLQAAVDRHAEAMHRQAETIKRQAETCRIDTEQVGRLLALLLEVRDAVHGADQLARLAMRPIPWRAPEEGSIGHAIAVALSKIDAELGEART